MVEISDLRQLDNEVDFVEQTSVVDVLKALCADAHEVGGFEVGDVEYVGDEIEFGREYEIVDEMSSNTGQVLFVDIDGQRKVIKTDLDQNHNYLNFTEKWIRLWSLAAECNMVRQAGGGTHEGVLGIERAGEKSVVFWPLENVAEAEVEPGLVMEEYEETLLEVAENDLQEFFVHIPNLVEGIVNMQQPLPDGYDAKELGSVDAFRGNLRDGNLMFLLNDRSLIIGRDFVSTTWRNIWKIGKEAIEKHGDLLDQREVAVRHGDNSLYNAGVLENGEVDYFDPVMLPLIYKQAHNWTILSWGAALWNIDNVERALGAATVDLRMLEVIAENNEDFELAWEYMLAKQEMIYFMAKKIGWEMGTEDLLEDVGLQEDKLILVKFGEAYWAQVKAEIYLRRYKEFKSEQNEAEAKKYLSWYKVLTSICLNTFRDLVETDPVSIS